MQCTKNMHQKYAKTLKQKVEIYANFPTEKFLSKVMVKIYWSENGWERQKNFVDTLILVTKTSLW